METLRITNGFNRLTDAGLLARTSQITYDLTTNFATAPGLPELIAARDAFNAALSTSGEGSQLEKAIKNQKRDELIELLHQMGNYILYICAGDRVKAVGSGFTIAKAHSPAPEVTKPANLKAEDGANAGEILFSFNRVPGARSYMYQCTPDPITETSNWTNGLGTVRRFVFSGLESGKRYWLRVAAAGINGQLVYSDAISRLAQ